jgi:hypothetical protein
METKIADATYAVLVGLASDEVGRMVYVGDEADLTDVARIRWFSREALVWAKDSLEAMNKVFRAANIGEYGWAEDYRAARSRSLSGGDFIKIVKIDNVNTNVTYQITSFGFEPVVLPSTGIQHEIYG